MAGLTYGDLAPYALKVQKDTGVPASIILAVITNEGGIGSNASSLATQYNNFYGIKAGDTVKGQSGSVALPTWEDYGAGPVNITAHFATFPDVATGLSAFVNFLADNSRYRNLVTSNGQAVVTDPNLFASLLQQDGYGTDPALASKYQSIAATPAVQLALAQAAAGAGDVGGAIGGVAGTIGSAVGGAASGVGTAVQGAIGGVQTTVTTTQQGVAGIQQTIQNVGSGVAGMGTAVTGVLAHLTSHGFWWSILFGAAALLLIFGGLALFFRQPIAAAGRAVAESGA